MIKLKVSVVIPTYNEAENIKILIPRIHEVLKNYSHEIVVVDDNSEDGTAEVAGELSESYPVRVFVRNQKLGLASAIVHGFENCYQTLMGVSE